MNCDWSELPQDLLGLITDKLRYLSLTEFIRFGSVCLEWRSFSIQIYQHINLPSYLPVLLIPIHSPPPPHSTIHHQQKIPSDEDDEQDEYRDEGEEEEDEGNEDMGEGEDGGNEDMGEGEDEDEDEEEEEDDDDDDEEAPRFKQENYFNPKDIWMGQEAKQRYKSTRNFYSISEKKVYHDFPLPIPYDKNIRGSSHGWLVTVEECYLDNNNGGQACYPVRLLNPFRTPGNNNEIQLPPLIHGNPGNIEHGEIPYHSYYLKKVYLSANPSSLSDLTKLVVLGVYGHYRLGFCRPGDKSWTTLDVKRPIFDMICYRGRFYAVLQSGYVISFVLDDAKPIAKLNIAPPKEENFRQLPVGSPRPSKRYLVESAGELLLVRRDVIWPRSPPGSSNSGINLIRYATAGFKVFKVDESGQWAERKTLDDRILFLGTSSSISLPVFPGCKPNSIYFTDDQDEIYYCYPLMGPHDIGVFNLEDGSIEPHYKLESNTIMPPPIWIQPML